MTTSPKSLSYPVLCIPESLGVFCVKSDKELERCRAVLFWKARLYEGLKIVDRSGARFEVVRATISSPRSGVSRWLARVLDLPVYLALELEDRGIASLSEIIKAVDASMKEDPEALEELSGKSIQWWHEVLSRCVTPGDVIARLSED